ncbi:prp1 [Candida pseudojiufengensis]|uniref:prp1 n=1 Tax=Candida pseudojiufengensis TaxID=497109 RepID=UPI002225036B|nr:prp1 [Candida pseudojiufengensis]KAI5962257.1 prp1 [Candida pseudojiufengensis]
MSSNKLAFLDQEAPPGYVAGVGRGAVGFSTGADFKHELPQVDDDDDDDDENLINQEINDKGLLVARKRTEEDEEEDKVYEQIEQRLKRRKTKPQQKQVLSGVKNEPDKRSQFLDLKKDLVALTEDDWMSIPEAGDMTRKNKRQRILDQQSQRLYAVPDQILAGNNGNFGFTRSLNTSNNKSNALSAQLDSLLASSRKTQNNGIEKELEQEIMSFDGVDRDAKYTDLKKSRLIFSSLRKTEPYKSSTWISSSRLEEDAKNFNKAREYIQQGCKMIPGDEDVWLENIRLNEIDTDFAKAISKEALTYCNKSIKLWSKAIDLEMDKKLKKRLVMKALQQLPRNLELWKKILELEDDSEVNMKLLLKAVDLCPHEWDLWLKLIVSSNYNDAKAHLNKARKIFLSDLKVWIQALKTEERENPTELSKLNKLAEKAVKDNKLTEPERWYEAALDLSNDGFKNSSRAVLEQFLKYSKFDSNALIAEAQNYNKFHSELSQIILNYVITSDPQNLVVWNTLFSILRKSRDFDLLFNYYKKAIESNPEVVTLYLSFAEDKWKLQKNATEAKSLLCSADDKLNDDSIKLAIFNMDFLVGDLNNAKLYIHNVIQSEPNRNVKFWYKYIYAMQCLESDPREVLKIIQDAIDIFPDDVELSLKKLQVLINDINDLQTARQFVSSIVDGNQACPALWIKYSEIEAKLGVLIKARSVLEKASTIYPQSVDIAIAQIELEKRSNNVSAVKSLTNKFVKKFSFNSYIWYLYLSLIPKMSHKKPEFVNALKQTNNSSEMLMFLGQFFWQDGKYSKAKQWLERSLEADIQNGDAWGWMNNYYKSHGTDVEKEKFRKEYEEIFDDINKGMIFLRTKGSPNNYNKTSLELLQLTSIELLKT